MQQNHKTANKPLIEQISYYRPHTNLALELKRWHYGSLPVLISSSGFVLSEGESDENVDVCYKLK